jgi:CheY-like chemotaxis protein
VFEEFQRLDAQSPWGERGLGLGLSICQRSAALLGHHLQLRSRPGRGSLFELEALRAAAPKAPPDIPAATALTQGAGRGLQVLCVDDDAENLAALSALLQRWGHRPQTASDPEAALLALRRERPALLLIDLQLQADLDGFALISILRREAGGELAAALVTAERSEAVLTRAREAGLPVLHKPLAPAALRALVEAVGARQADVQTRAAH